jgi:hypothetical protein
LLKKVEDEGRPFEIGSSPDADPGDPALDYLGALSPDLSPWW